MQLDKQRDFNSSAGASSAGASSAGASSAGAFSVDASSAGDSSAAASSEAASTAAEVTCLVPISHFFYVNHIYNKELKHIEEKNGINIKAEVNVTFEAARGDGSPQNALSEFITLVQKCLGDSHSSVIPLKHLGTEELKDTLKIIKTPENKLLLALSSREMIVYGPKQSQDAISESLKATTKSPTVSHNFNEFNETSPHPSPDIGMSIKDPLTAAGLTMNGDHWRLMTTSFRKRLSKIEAKFGVHFQASAIGQSTDRVRAVHKRSGGNAAMESHAARALLHLYQEIVTSPMNLSTHGEASASPNSWEDLYTAEGASNGLELNSSLKTTASAEEGATVGDNPEETCPICMDTFTKKKRLKCKHEFCGECLAKSKESIGSVCPVCKDVFGIITGDQPDGTMNSNFQRFSLPGFPTCDTIVITYDIPSGIQKVNVFKYLGTL